MRLINLRYLEEQIRLYNKGLKNDAMISYRQYENINKNINKIKEILIYFIILELSNGLLVRGAPRECRILHK